MLHCIPGEKSREETVNRKLQMAHTDHAERNMKVHCAHMPSYSGCCTSFPDDFKKDEHLGCVSWVLYNTKVIMQYLCVRIYLVSSKCIALKAWESG